MPRQNHPEELLTTYVRGELAGEEARRVSAHLEECARCQETAQSSRELLDELKTSLSAAPPVDWDAYGDQLRDKLRARRSAGEFAAGWFRRPWTITASIAGAAVAGLLAFFLVQSQFRSHDQIPDLTPWQQAAIGSQLDLLENYQVVEHLDLLEDFDVIQDLDQTSAGPGGADAQSNLGGDRARDNAGGVAA